MSKILDANGRPLPGLPSESAQRADGQPVTESDFARAAVELIAKHLPGRDVTVVIGAEAGPNLVKFTAHTNLTGEAMLLFLQSFIESQHAYNAAPKTAQ